MIQSASGNPPQALLTLSMKGGVGRTTTAIGLAKALQHRGMKVGLLDVDTHGSAPPRARGVAYGSGLTAPKERPERPDFSQDLNLGSLLGAPVGRNGERDWPAAAK